MRQFLCAALVAVIAASCPALAQNTPMAATGDWHGTINRPPVGDIRLGLHIEGQPGALTGKLMSVDQGVTTPLGDIAVTGDTFSFTVPASRASFSGKWDAAAKAWIGTYKHPAGDSTAKFEPGAFPPPPPLPTVAGLDGRWEGKLQGVLPVILRIVTDASGTRAFMDIPAQQSTDVPLRSLTRDGAHVTFGVTGMSYDGQLSGESISGAFTQQGQSAPVTFTRTSAAATPSKTSARPQTPRPPFPYTSVDVTVDNPFQPSVHLGCTLTTPPGPPAPVAVLISGSGAQDRNANVLGHQTFAVLADHLARNGIAALRCDHRAYGKSSDYGYAQTLSDLVTDARAGAAFLRTRKDIDPKRIGYIGHSLGAVIGPIAASQEKDTAFLVLLAGLGVPAADAIAEQRARLAEIAGATPTEAAEIRKLWPGVNRQLAAAKDTDAARAIARAALKQTPKARQSVYPTDDLAIEAMTSPYSRSTLAYDPAPVFAKIRAPVLALNGALDVQVSARQNLPGLRKLLLNGHSMVAEVPNLNHPFQHARSGAMEEYADIEETFAPEALAQISDWIRANTSR